MPVLEALQPTPLHNSHDLKSRIITNILPISPLLFGLQCRLSRCTFGQVGHGRCWTLAMFCGVHDTQEARCIHTPSAVAGHRHWRTRHRMTRSGSGREEVEV